MKRIFLSIIAVFTIIFILAGFLVNFKNENVYNFIYPQTEVSFVEDNPDVVKLKNGDYFALGTYSGEKLVWKYIAQNKVQCDKIIEFRRYDDKSSDWKSSELRHWLNSNDGFLGKSAIDKSFFSGEIYILSKSELEKTDSRTKQPTLSAIKKSKSKYLFLRKNCWYWTSSGINTNSQSVATVTQNGGFYKTLPTDSLTGVCPAFTLKNSTVHILGGDGSKSKPYVIG